MAMAQQLPKKSGNVACHVVQSLFLDRLCSLMNPIEIALLLKEKALISDSTLELVMLKEDEQQSRKNYRILHDVLPCLSNGDKLSEFCEVLKTFERLKEIGQEIWKKYEEILHGQTQAAQESLPGKTPHIVVQGEDTKIQAIQVKYASVFAATVQDLNSDRNVFELLRSYAAVLAQPRCVSEEKIMLATTSLEVLVTLGIHRSWVDTSLLESILRDMSVVASLERLREYNRGLKEFGRNILGRLVDPYLPSREVTSNTAQIHLVVESDIDRALLAGFFRQKTFLSQLLEVPKEYLQLVHIREGSVVGVWHVSKQLGNRMWSLLSTEKVLVDLLNKRVIKVRVVFSDQHKEMDVLKKMHARVVAAGRLTSESIFEEDDVPLEPDADLIAEVQRLREESQALQNRLSELEERLEENRRPPGTRRISLLRPIASVLSPTYKHIRSGTIALGSFVFSPLIRTLHEVGRQVIYTRVPLTRVPRPEESPSTGGIPTEGTPVDASDSPSPRQRHPTGTSTVSTSPPGEPSNRQGDHLPPHSSVRRQSNDLSHGFFDDNSPLSSLDIGQKSRKVRSNLGKSSAV